MDNQPSFNRDLIIPILIGGVSVIGILAVLLIGRSLSAPAEIPMTPSDTPFQYIYLGTEPAITTPLVEGSEIASPTGQSPFDTPPFDTTPINTPPLFPTSTGSSVSTPLILNTATGSVLRTSTPNRIPTSTATSGTASAANTYDDTDPRLQYSGTWISQTNVNGAHQGTLHVSNTIGDAVTFTFTGQEIHVFYQSGPSLGSVAITIDSAGPPPFSQAQNETQIKEWVYQLDSGGTHSIVIQHFGGGSINIDSIYVPGPTPTPTRTATP